MPHISTDVIISGGGLVGGTLAVALASAGVKVVVIDRDTPEALLDPKLDGRTTAVSYGSQQMFEVLGIWPDLVGVAEPILDIRVFESGSPWAVYYDHKDVGSHPMGYIVENRSLRQAIFRKAEELSSLITWIAPGEIENREMSETFVEITVEGRVIKAPLLVVAEGRFSPTRQKAGIQTTGWQYSQTALVCHMTHDQPHKGVAWEIFFPEGPFAILPLPDCPETGKHKSGLVWALPTEIAQEMMEKSDEELSKDLTGAFPHYGSLKVIGQRWSYPLSAMIADEFIHKRMAVIGDAAHVVHPVAGQGVNVGWCDAATLAEVIVEARRGGADIGSQTVLNQYKRLRRLDTLSVLGMCDGMVRLFSNRSSILHFLRNTGLGIVNVLPPLKRLLMRKAMGVSGETPRLMQGRKI